MTGTRIFTAVLAAASVGALLSACASHQPRAAIRTPASLAAAEWPGARQVAVQAALQREFGRADSLLRAFAARYPGTESAGETTYWRSLFHLDPLADGPGSHVLLRQARTELDSYLAGGPELTHRAEALTLRRVVGRLDSLHAGAEVVRPVPGAQAARDSVRVRDEETTRLRAELDQTKSELERLRKRLAPPRP